MRGLAIGIALALILVLVPGGHFLLVLLMPLAFFALLMFRTSWQPYRRPIAPEPEDRARLDTNEARCRSGRRPPVLVRLLRVHDRRGLADVAAAPVRRRDPSRELWP
jgi:hypothetical protein